MYICILTDDGNTYEFWGVRSWNYSKDKNDKNILWVYFLLPVMPDGSNYGYINGYIKEATVVSSFIHQYGVATNNPENLKIIN